MQRQTYSPWRPLRDVRLLLICGILLTAAAVTGFLNYVSVRQSTQDAAVEQLAGEARLTGLNVKNVFLQMERDAAIISQTPPIQGVVRSRKTSGIDFLDGSSEKLWQQRLGTILISMMRQRPEYTQMRYIGLADNGREIVRVNRRGQQLLRVPDHELQQKGGESYMQQHEDWVASKGFFSNVNYNRERGEVEDPKTPVIRVIVPVFDEGTGAPFGAVVINADYEKLLRKALAELRPAHRAYVINGQGDYLTYEPAQGAVSQLEFHEAYSTDVPMAVRNFLARTVPEASNTDGDTINYAIRLDVLGDGKTLLGVVVEVEKDRLLAPAGRVRSQAVALTFVLLGTVVAFAWLLIRHYTAPLTSMTNAVLDGGGVDALPVGRRDEIGALARAFVSLTENLTSMEAKSRAVLETVNDGIITIDPYGKIASINPAGEAIFGYRAEECIGQNVKMLMPPHFSRDHDQHLSEYRRTGRKQIIGFGREVEGMRKDGSTFALDLSVSEMVVDGAKMYTGIVRDISERKETEVRLQEQREFLDLVMNTNPNLIFVLDLDLNIIQANRAFIDTWPASLRETVIGASMSAFLSDADQAKFKNIVTTAHSSGYSEATGAVTFADGRVRSLFLQSAGFANKSGKSFVLCIGRDQSELEKLTELLQMSNKELDEFAYVASHDLKTPLRVIDNASSWLEEDLAGVLDEDSRENLSLIRSRVSRMERLLDDLLEYSRIGRKLSVESEDMVAGDVLLSDVLGLLAGASDGKVVVNRDFADIVLPRMPLQQIFLNLIGNAIKHCGNENVRVDVDVEDQGDFYCFKVKDNGPGIASDYHSQIFQMFQTLKPRDVVEGSGMGLAIVRKHVEQYGGRIWLRSREGEGATFFFTWRKLGDTSEGAKTRRT